MPYYNNFFNNFEITCGVVIYDEVSRIKTLIHKIESENISFIEWIFVLNHPDLQLRLLIKDYITRILPKALLYENAENNIATARNLILNHATKDWIYFTDPDIDLNPQSLNILTEAALKLKNKYIIGLGGPVLYKSTNFKIQKTFDLFSTLMKFLPYSFLIQNHQKIKQVDHIPTCHLLLNRHSALSLNGFDPSYSRYGEDLEFSHRATVNNFHFLFIPQGAVTHWQNISFNEHLSKIFNWGKVQILSMQSNWEYGIRWYRLLPLLLILILVLFFIYLPIFTLIFISFLIVSSFFHLGILGVTQTCFYYALGELYQLINLRPRLNNEKAHPVTSRNSYN